MMPPATSIKINELRSAIQEVKTVLVSKDPARATVEWAAKNWKRAENKSATYRIECAGIVATGSPSPDFALRNWLEKAEVRLKIMECP